MTIAEHGDQHHRHTEEDCGAHANDAHEAGNLVQVGCNTALAGQYGNTEPEHAADNGENNRQRNHAHHALTQLAIIEPRANPHRYTGKTDGVGADQHFMKGKAGCQRQLQ
ncbi:MAG: hypothetical protein M3Y65_15400 [Pseudomonadota bacterium]|nr:hypothetical protein [Pseudomonadota bacterium]